MRIRAGIPAAVLLALAACEGHQGVADPADAIPTVVNCEDAAPLRQRAAADRRRVEQSSSDHERISIGSRANFLASLAVIADLKCKVSTADAVEALKPALEAARKAQSNNSVYEKTRGFAEADFAAHRVIELLIQQVASSAR